MRAIPIIFSVALVGCASSSSDMQMLSDCNQMILDDTSKAGTFLGVVCFGAGVATLGIAAANAVTDSSRQMREQERDRAANNENRRCTLPVETELSSRPMPELLDVNTAFNRKDYCSALLGFTQLSTIGNKDAKLSLGLMYEHGYGVEVDPAKSAALYRDAMGK